MDEKITAWLKDNVEKYRNPDGRVRIGAVESAIEASLGASVGNQELYAWLEENGYMHPFEKVTKKEIKKMVEGVKMGKVGWPKGRPRGKRKSKVGLSMSIHPVNLNGAVPFTGYIVGGRVLIPLEDAQRIFK